MPSNRIERANSELQRCLSEILQNKLNDPRLTEMMYVSEVNVTPDFKYCKVKIGMDTNNRSTIDTSLNILKKSSGFIKKQLAEMVKMPYIPELIFEYDKGMEASIRINEILKTLNIPEKRGEDDE